MASFDQLGFYNLRDRCTPVGVVMECSTVQYYCCARVLLVLEKCSQLELTFIGWQEITLVVVYARLLGTAIMHQNQD